MINTVVTTRKNISTKKKSTLATPKTIAAKNLKKPTRTVEKKTLSTKSKIDDVLIAKAIKVSGLTTKKEVIEQGLKLIIQRSNQQAIRELRGKLKWEGDLNEMRDGK